MKFFIMCNLQKRHKDIELLLRTEGTAEAEITVGGTIANHQLSTNDNSQSRRSCSLAVLAFFKNIFLILNFLVITIDITERKYFIKGKLFLRYSFSLCKILKFLSYVLVFFFSEKKPQQSPCKLTHPLTLKE